MAKWRYIDNQTKVKVVARVHQNELDSFWFKTLAAAIFAAAFYFFSLFFGFSGWRVVTES